MSRNTVESLLLELELYPNEQSRIEESYNRINSILKGTFGTEAFIIGENLISIRDIDYYYSVQKFQALL